MLRRSVCPCCFVDPSSPIFFNQKSLKMTNGFGKHSYTGLPPYAQSVSGAIRQRGSILFWKNYERNKNRNKTKNSGSSSLPHACGLWSSRWVHVFRRPPNTQLLRVSPEALMRASGASESGGQERNQLKRGGGWSTNPQTSPLRQSPKAVLMEVSTEDGADISGKPKCIQHREQV